MKCIICGAWIEEYEKVCDTCMEIEKELEKLEHEEEMMENEQRKNIFWDRKNIQKNWINAKR